MHIEWFIIDALVSLIVGFVPGLFLGTHLTRGHFTHFMHQDALPPYPQPQTQALPRSRLPRLPMNREYAEEEEPYY